MMSQLLQEQSTERYDQRSSSNAFIVVLPKREPTHHLRSMVTHLDRRVTLLKAQLYQTERQLLLLQDGMARRTAALWETENILKVG